MSKGNQPFILFIQFSLFVILFFLSTISSIAQSTYSSQVEMDKALKEAKQLMLAKRGNESLPITETLMNQLKKEGRYNSHFGFEVRLIHGLGLINSGADVATFDFLWELKDESRKYKKWSVFADASREMARVQEFSGQSQEAYDNLKEAQTVIFQHDLDSVYASFAVRYSSWHRIFGDLDSAGFYAQEAIRVAPKYDQTFEEAEGNLLMGLVSYKKDVSQVIPHFKRAAYLYHEVGEMATYSSMQSSLARQYLRNNQLQTALIHADTAQLYCIKYLNSNAYNLNRAYKVKADIYKQMGEIDSAFTYLKKGHELELESTRQTRTDLLQEVDKKYNVEKKAEELKTEQQKNRFLFAIIFLVIAFILALAYYYRKLQKANELTRKQSEKLKNLDRLKSRFFANVSHELRTPLTLILAPVREILSKNQINKKTRYHLKLIEKNSLRLQKMVMEILDLSKLEAGKMTINSKPVDWHLFLRKIHSSFESLAEFKKITYHFYYEGAENLRVNIDESKVETILNNLLSNAFKFTSSNGEINMFATVLEQELYVEIQDTGRGIAPEDLPNIFNRFYQTKGKANNLQEQVAEGGTGIGLALTKELVNILDGSIEAESQLGQQTTFRVKFPLDLAQEEAVIEDKIAYEKVKISTDEVTAAPMISAQNSIETKTILLVEDNPDLSLFISSFLSEYYNVITAQNGKEALNKLRVASYELTKNDATNISNPQLATRNPHLIISDVMMPVMDGFELLKNLKSNPNYRNIPVIMLTARAALKDKLNALRIGVDDYLTKPFVKEELLTRIENLIQNAQGRLEAATIEEDTSTEQKVVKEEDNEAQEWLNQLEQTILKNIAISDFTIDSIAAELFMSNRQFYRKVKKHIGLTPLQYIKTYKLNHARNLLETREVNSVKAAAYSIGYPNVVYFSREFRKAFGRLPSEYLE
jgi:signal transduction histidine kinase/DNA-binding response OmpR family regulator